ncbi:MULTISPECIES: SDR family NAD(P)-dependent oxidoreductase [unclassified Crossiella]|uniref:SDR family NAD(P)-dependent oxidoreductase n=1 Tax=unclassified Crossiella TaxID=2620835 RepID=UPI00200025B9|nr:MULTISPECIES: SDR family NAD(P)-dependent oxidoreductase [unclassified Crossiella]MCK2242093.1 SDR family NAD(P)-dependent oxidoreductase [Crossiella sp. S99.2]MCK2255996.1 SDR family NAD(P)-dependent oxidoreductase [Crossiella sp. S99.1]
MSFNQRAEGRNFLVTGGNAGIGYFVAEQLAATGATVLLGSRNPARAEAALTSIRTRVPGARVRHLAMDLADLSSLKSTVDDLAVDRLDAVVLNAGVYLDEPDRRLSAEGHELMFATNHLGHFALIAHLAPLLAATAGSRVVTTGSLTAKSVALDFDDLHSTRDYQPARSYARSKLAQMLFGFEFARRSSTTLSVITHPGGALDSLTPSRPPVHVRTTGQRLGALPAGMLLQGKDKAARIAVHAVLDPAVRPGQLWLPRVFGLRGAPREAAVRGVFADRAAAARLWQVSAELTGIEPELG